MSRRWLSLCAVWPSHSQWPSEQIKFSTLRLPILQLSCRIFFFKSSHHPGLSVLLKSRFGSLRLSAFLKAKIAVEREEICKCDGNTVHKLSQRRLNADWLAPRESDCSQMYSKASPDWLPSYIKTTPPVLEIFKMVGRFPDSCRTCVPRLGTERGEIRYFQGERTPLLDFPR